MPRADGENAENERTGNEEQIANDDEERINEDELKMENEPGDTEDAGEEAKLNDERQVTNVDAGLDDSKETAGSVLLSCCCIRCNSKTSK